jgi:hypothetical protein
MEKAQNMEDLYREKRNRMPDNTGLFDFYK